MSTPENELSLLLAELSAPSRPAVELLVRYADAPDTLGAAERAEVETALRADPLLAGELRALQSLRMPDATRLRRCAWLERLRAGIRVVGWLAALAAATLAAVLCGPE